MAGGVVLPPSTAIKKKVGEIPPLSLKVKLSLVAIFTKGFLDVIGNYAVMPALIFYVRELGGTDSQYGLISAASSLAACLMMPIYANWVDTSGNQFRKPFFVGMSLAVLGMLLYTLAVTFGSGMAVHVLLASRLIYGIGAASGSISVSYITSVVDPEQLTSVILNMGIVTFSGLGVAPYVNEFLADVDTSINFLGMEIPLNAYNSVGLLIASFELFGLCLIYFLLPEPPAKTRESIAIEEDLPKQESGGWTAVLRELTTDIKLFLPLFAIFVAQSNYQLIEVSFPPAVGHGLGWGPVAVSETLAYSSMVMGITTAVATILSNKYKVTDTTLIVSGNTFWAVGGIAMYSFWTYPAKVWHYVAPIVIAFIGSPLIYPANQSNYYKATMARPELEPIQARLQSIYGIVGEMANFMTPLFVGAFVLRSPSAVESGTNDHELSSLALYVPIFSIFCIIGFLYEKIVLHADDDDDDDDEEDEVGTVASESTSLLTKNRRSSLASITLSLSSESEATRLRNSSIMGGNQSMPILIPFETPTEQKRRLKLLNTQRKWQALIDKAKEAENAETPAEPAQAETPAATSNKRVIVLVTSYAANPNIKFIQDRAMTILKGLKVSDDQLETIDAAKELREKTNDLFRLSGIWAKYPQFFVVDQNDQTNFLASWEDFFRMNENGTLKETINLKAKEAENAETPAEPAQAETPAATGNKKVIVLVTSYAANPNIKANQDRAMTILKGLKVGDDQLETIDGAAYELREKRNELFRLSGIRAKYPQFFVVDQNYQTNFLASWEDFEMMNEMGTLKESINLQ